MESPRQEKTGTSRGIFLSLQFLKELGIVTVLGFLAWRIVTAKIDLTFSQFQFSDVLAMVLALFAVGLSTAFYFKATDTSNRFYDNTYKFTKEMSEILGRIEAGFGERLRHLDDSYSGIRERFDKFPVDPTKVAAKVVREEAEVEKFERERRKLIEDLAERAKLADQEKTELFEQLAKVSSELDSARSELNRLKHRSAVPGTVHSRHLRQRVSEYLARKITDEAPDEALDMLSTSQIREFVQNELYDLPDDAIRDLREAGMLSDAGRLTQFGARSIQMAIRNIRGDTHE